MPGEPARNLGSRKEIIPQYGAGFGFGTQTHASAHIGICGGGWNAGDEPTDKQDEELFLSEALNQRKTRKGAFWEDRYHATAVENGEHLMQCLVYIDLNMVRTGVVTHPAEWPYSGYNEIQEPKRKNVLINYERLREFLGFDAYDEVKIAHRSSYNALLGVKKRIIAPINTYVWN